MKILSRSSFLLVSLSLGLGLTGQFGLLAATTPSLGAAASYAVLASTYTASSAATTVNGDIGFTIAPAITPLGTHPNFGSADPYSTAGGNQGTALSGLASQACTFSFGAAVDLSTDTTHGTTGVFTPGVYCSTGAMNVTGPLTLSGSGTYIFRAVGALNTAASAAVTLNGASACDVFWTPTGAATLGASTSFQGTVITDAGITVGASATWTGRALGFNGNVTTGATDTITVPTCVVPPVPATLHVIKQVINNNGGIATPSVFNLHVKLSGTDVVGSPASGAAFPGISYSLAAGTYVVSEDANANYNHTFSGDCDSGGNVTLTAGSDKTCTMINDDIPAAIPPASINVVKIVINDNGGTKTITDFPLFVGGTPVVSGATNVFPAPAGYNVTETTDANYTQTFSGDCDINGHVNLVPGDSKFCVITNDDIPPIIIPPPPPPPPTTGTINVVKTVINDNGRTKSVADFPLFVSGSLVLSGATNTFPAPASYTISETTDSNYAQTFFGDCDSSGHINLTAGANAFCVITNNDIPPIIIPPTPPPPPTTGTINVVKTVINDNGRTKSVADFPLFVNGTLVISGATNTFAAPAGYNVTETSDSNYTRTFSGDCDINGHINLTSGDNAFCVITNNDIPPVINPPPSGGGSGISKYVQPVPPLIDLVIVPSPLALPSGSGLVTYTYTLRNLGTGPMTDITLVGDSCSPITLVSGDTNQNSVLEVNEIWTYRCSMLLSATTTSTVVATGWANGLSASDIASATVVVGAPVVAPLIHVIKVPSPLTLAAGGGIVTYTEKITNPGTEALRNVLLTDDKCAPLSYVSGDANRDSELEPTETWTYTCLANLTKTTTNTAIASGQANGFTVRDFAIATVVVAPSAVPIISPLPSGPGAKCMAIIIFSRSLSFGNSNASVWALQQLLQCLGYFPANLKLTNYFGSVTRIAVRKFQLASGIAQVGSVGPLTRAALNRYFVK